MTFTAVLIAVLKIIWPMIQLIATGTLLGIGFYIAKLITVRIEVWRYINNKEFMDELKGM